MEDLSLQAKNYQINDGFRYVEDHLYCEEMCVRDLLNSKVAENVTSPFYVYSKRQVETNINKYKAATKKTGRTIQLNYSVKANMNPAILKIMKEHGLSLTLVSGLELQLALELGFEPKTIVFNGNGKLDWEVDLACKSSVLINVDSMFNLRQTIRVCKMRGYVAQVLLRINPDINPGVHSYVSTGQHTSKFGIPSEELNDVLEMASASENIRVIGLHCHIGSTIRDAEKFRQSTQILVELYRKLRDRFPAMNILNLGGGLGIPYKEQIKVPEEIKQRIKHVCEHCREPEKVKLYQDLLNHRLTLPTFFNMLTSCHDGEKLALELRQHLPTDVLVSSPEELVNIVSDILPPDTIAILEPGRSLVGNSAIFMSRVLGTKFTKDKNYIVLDGSMTEVIRPCLYGAYHHIDLAEPNHVNPSSQSPLLWDVVGPVCESSDFLGKDRQLVTPNEGCCIAVFDTGAYCSSMSSNYNMRVRPAELLIEGNKVTVIRKCETFESMMHCYSNWTTETS